MNGTFLDGWNLFLYDTVTGLIGQQIDVPAFTWAMSVSDAAFQTSKDKGVGVDEVSGLELPWSQIPGVDAAARASALMPYKRGIVAFWHCASDDVNSPGRPILAGALGVRTSTRNDVSMPFVSMMGLLEERYLVHEGGFGTGPNHSSRGEFRFENLSWRALACEVIRQCTSVKPGGELPIDLPYLGERGTHRLPDVGGDDDDADKSKSKAKAKSDGTVARYRDFNVSNHSCAGILRAIANSAGGPDMQFRPYLTEDGNHIRFRFIAGSDGDVYLHQDRTLSLSSYEGVASTLENISVDRAAPVMRVYGTGSGTGSGTLCYLAEDLTLVRRQDSWPLVERVFQDSTAEDIGTLRAGTTGVLDANRRPLMQIKGELNANDMAGDTLLHPFGSFWPGERFDLDINGFPDLPDGVYSSRLMQVSGDETARCKLTFDIMADPVE